PLLGIGTLGRRRRSEATERVAALGEGLHGLRVAFGPHVGLAQAVGSEGKVRIEAGRVGEARRRFVPCAGGERLSPARNDRTASFLRAGAWAGGAAGAPCKPAARDRRDSRT